MSGSIGPAVLAVAEQVLPELPALASQAFEKVLQTVGNASNALGEGNPLQGTPLQGSDPGISAPANNIANFARASSNVLGSATPNFLGSLFVPQSVKRLVEEKARQQEQVQRVNAYVNFAEAMMDITKRLSERPL